MGEKKNTDIFEYAFTRKQFKQRMWSYLGMYLVLRILRTIFYITMGAAYFSSMTAGFLVFFTGIVFGLAIITVIYYRKAVKIEGLTSKV